MPLMVAPSRCSHAFFATACSASTSSNSTTLTAASSSVTDVHEFGGAAVERVSSKAKPYFLSGQIRPHVEYTSGRHMLVLVENDETTAGGGTSTHATGNRATAPELISPSPTLFLVRLGKLHPVPRIQRHVTVEGAV